MLTLAQFRQVEDSFRHGDELVFRIEGRGVFVADRVLKHKKEATIEMRGCFEVDETCFYDEDYFGDTLGKEINFILADPYAGYDSAVATVYYEDEIKEEF